MPPARPIRVAHALEFPTVAGGERSLLAVLAAFDRTRVASVVVAPERGPLATAVRALGVRVVPTLDAAAPFDVVHANSLTTAIRIADRTATTPSIAHVRDIMRLGAARRDALLTHDAIVAVSNATADALVDQGVPRDRITVIHNGIDVPAPIDARAGAAVREALGVPTDTPLVGNVGQICLRKAQDVFLDAAARVAARDPRPHFVVLGERFSRKAESVAFERGLRERAATAPLAGRVHLPGWRDDARTWIAAFDVLAHTANQEPLGRVLLEALAAGTAIVATDVGGTREIVDDALARLVPRGDAAAAADAIERALASPDGACDARRAAARERFSIDACATALEARYRWLTSRRL